MGKFLVNHTDKKLLARKNLVNMAVNKYVKYNFAISVTIDEENVGE